MQQLRDRPRVGAGEQATDSENGEEPPLSSSRSPQREKRKRERDAPSLSARHEKIAEGVARERKEIRQQRSAGKARRHAQRPRREELSADAMLDGLGAGVEEGQQRDGADEQRHDAGADRAREHASALPVTAPQQFEDPVDRAHGGDVQQCLRMTGKRLQRERDGKNHRGADRRRIDDAARGHQDERKERPSKAERPEDLQRDGRGEREDGRANERSHLTAQQFTGEQKRAQGGQEECDRRGEAKACRGRQEQGDERQRAEGRRLCLPCQHVAATFEAIEQRPLAARHRAAHRLAPRNHLKRDVRKHPVVRLRHSKLCAMPPQRLARVRQFNRCVDTPRQQRSACEDERQEQQRERHRAREAGHARMREEEQRQGSGEVEG